MVEPNDERDAPMGLVYELLYLTPLQDTDTARQAVRDRVAKVIQEGGGSVAATREVARQRLAYPIKRHAAGEYTLVEFTVPGGAVAGIQRELRLFGDLLRMMVTTKLEKARAVGAELEAMERAQARQDAAKAVVAERAPAPTRAEPPQPIEDLDKRLEEILGKEMV